MLSQQELFRARLPGEIDIVDEVTRMFRDRGHTHPDFWVDPLSHSIRANVRTLNWRLQMKAICDFFVLKIGTHGLVNGEDTRTVRAFGLITSEESEVGQVLAGWDKSLVMYMVDRNVSVY
jgi:hypothetical protein